MSSCLFKPTSCSIGLLVENIAHGSLGLPDIQRPFVWSNAQVRDFFDSIFRGYPAGFLLFWEADSDGSEQIGVVEHGSQNIASLIIDGQQRLTSLYAVMKGAPILDKNFKERHIKIAFQPSTGKFEVTTPAFERSAEWISNISELFKQNSSFAFTKNFLEKIKEAQGDLSEELEETISSNIATLLNIRSYQFQSLDINAQTDAEIVADIFIRVNSGGQKLKQSDFVLTLMSNFWSQGRSDLEEFCKQSRLPSADKTTAYNDFIKPEPGTMLRVPILLAFKRAQLKYAYQILRGKDLETGEVTPILKAVQFEKYKDAQSKSLNLQNWKDFLTCLCKSGFRSDKMISSEMAIIYSYGLFLIGKYDFNMSGDTLSNAIARWFFMVTMTSRYSNASETVMESDLAGLRGLTSEEQFLAYLENIINATLTNDFWDITLPNNLATSSARSPSLFAYEAALVLLNAPVLFDKNLTLSTMLSPSMNGTKNALERHHLFPKAYLASIGIEDDRDRNQIANYALIAWDRNNKISDESPAQYFPLQIEKHSNIPNLENMLRLHALPDNWVNMEYFEFLEKRRTLIANIIREGFNMLDA